MSNLNRLKRVFDSWVGNMRKNKQRRVNVYNDDDALLIITDLGLQMSQEAFAFMSETKERMADFLLQVYAAEDELGVDLIKDNVCIDPAHNPRVYEEEGMVVFTADIKGEEFMIAEFVQFPDQTQNVAGI